MPPGRYQLRVGARDTTGGQVGTVFSDVLVPDFTREPLMLSGLLLSSDGTAEVLTAQRDALAERLLGAPPSARRTFSQRETLRAMAEIYDNMPATQPRQIEVHARLIGEDGHEAFSSTSHLKNGPGPEPAWSAIGFRTEIPLENVPAGRYLLRVEAMTSRNGTPVTTEALISVTTATQ
jgi:hypothetical protein